MTTAPRPPREHTRERRDGEIRLCVVGPCYNEVEVLPRFHRELKRVLDSLDGVRYEILFVDDGSTDGTLETANRIAAEDPTVRVCSLSRNFGHQVAITAGLDHADGDAVIMMDTDLQHPPALIPEMIARYREGYDIVSAVRRDAGVESWFKRVTSDGFYAFLGRISRTRVPAGVADFSLLARPVHRALRGMPERHRFVRGLLAWVGFDRAFVEYEVAPRAAGESKYTLRRMLGMALDAVFSFSSAPLRLATRIGVGVTLAGFVYLAWILGHALFARDLVPGWASLIGVVLVLGGFQLLFIGLIGEYLARVFEEVKGRPLYVLRQEPRAPFSGGRGAGTAGGTPPPGETAGPAGAPGSPAGGDAP